MATPLPDAYKVVPVTKRYYWPHPKARAACRNIPWGNLKSWYVDWVVGHRYFVHGKEVFLTEVPNRLRKPSVEFLAKPGRRRKDDDSFTFINPEKDKKP